MKEFVVGQKVIHLREGLSEIMEKKMMGDNEFFVVHIYRGNGETIYVPVKSASAIIREVLSIDEADIVLKELKDVEKEFNTNTKQRRDAYKRRLASGNIRDMAYMYRQLYLYKKYPEGVKLGPADIDMLEYATHYILDEMSLTYNVDKDKIEEFVLQKIEN